MTLRTESWIRSMDDLCQECFNEEDLELLQELFVSVLIERAGALKQGLEN